jgi:hypothetical protein
MNCNRETAGTNVFCEHCQQAMEGFPVPKGTPVIIPNTPSPAASRKQSTHLYASADEQLNITRRTVRFFGPQFDFYFCSSNISCRRACLYSHFWFARFSRLVRHCIFAQCFT